MKTVQRLQCSGRTRSGVRCHRTLQIGVWGDAEIERERVHDGFVSRYVFRRLTGVLVQKRERKQARLFIDLVGTRAD